MATSEDKASQVGHVVEARGVNIYYQTCGAGKPLILFHAGSLSGDMWQPYLARFVERYRVIVPDMPAHGRSSSPTRALNYRQLADDIVAFITAIDVRNPIVVGFSDGGQVALEIGMRYPTLPQSIAMSGVVFRYGDALRAFVRSALGDENSPDVDTALLARNHPDWAGWLDEIYGPDGWKPLLVRLKQMWTTPLNYTANDFAKVVAPTLILIGDRDELVPVEEAVEMYRLLRRAELSVIPNADHSAFFAAKAALFQSHILDFLERHGV